MIRNYLTVAFRNLIRQKLYTFINVFGLSIGVACCILIALFVQHEWSYDRFHENGDRLFRVIFREESPTGNVRFRGYHPEMMGPELKVQFDEVVRSTRFVKSGGTIRSGDKQFQQSVGLVDPDFLMMFSFPLLAGDSETALSSPDGVVLHESTFRRFFGDANLDYDSAIGRSLEINARERLTLTITGVLKEWPRASSHRFDALVSFTHWEKFGRNNDWGGFNEVYVELSSAGVRDGLTSRLPAFAASHQADRIAEWRERGRMADRDDAYQLMLQNVRDIHHDDRVNRLYTRGETSPEYAYALVAVGFLIFAIANINFATLAVGRSTRRSLEVGVRKVLGAGRLQIMRQFWGEGVLLGILALMVGVALAEGFLPEFNRLSRVRLSIPYEVSWQALVGVPALILIIGFVAGSYPAVLLSAIQPVRSLKGEGSRLGRSGFGRVLMVLQYTISVVLIVGSLVMWQQLDFLRAKPLGFDKDHLVVVRINSTEQARVGPLLKQRLLELDGVQAVSHTGHPFAKGSSRNGMTLSDGSLYYMKNYRADYDYLATFDMELIAGRDFSPSHSTDAAESVIVNQAAARMFGWENPVGERLPSWGEWDMVEEPAVIGVVKDFHHDNLRRTLEPVVLHMGPGRTPTHVVIKVSADGFRETVDSIESVWTSVEPGMAFISHFMDEALDSQYATERRWTSIIGYAAGLAVFIACLGLLGLTAQAVTQRTKEIGIRKVLGASIPGLLALLSSDFVKLIAIANVIAWPIAYFIMVEWLRTFAYRVDVSLLTLVGSGAVVLLVAIGTMSAMTSRAARRNPVEALRYE